MANNSNAQLASPLQSAKKSARPFVKWVGGKTQLLPELISRLPARFKNYFEPFVGGGALFWSTQPKRSRLSDANADLINVYQVVQSRVDELIRDLKKHVYEEEYFYNVRNVDRLPHFKRWSEVRRASRFIFLNKTCFNGLYRVNSKGGFNAPFGRYTNPTIVDEDNLHACNRALQQVDISLRSFEQVLGHAKRGDFVYFDPPYVPLSVTSYFTGYNAKGFDLAMQELLYEICVSLSRKGVKFMLSNSSAPFVVERYKEFNLELVQATRAINSKAERRGRINEVIVRNYR